MKTRAQSIYIRGIFAVSTKENGEIEVAYQDKLPVRFGKLPGMFILTKYTLIDIEVVPDKPLYILDIEMESVKNMKYVPASVEFADLL